MFLLSITLFIASLMNFTALEKGDCAGIPMKKIDFEKSVDQLNELYSNKNIRSKEDFILSVRVYNTLTMNHMMDGNETYKLFYDNFSKNLEKTVKALKASISKGMGFYSKKYNIFIGGQRDDDSIFCLE